VRLQDGDGWEPLHFACRSGHLEVVQWLTSQQVTHITSISMCTHTHTHTHIYIYIYIYIYIGWRRVGAPTLRVSQWAHRSGPVAHFATGNLSSYISIYLSIYIYIYKHIYLYIYIGWRRVGAPTLRVSQWAHRSGPVAHFATVTYLAIYLSIYLSIYIYIYIYKHIYRMATGGSLSTLRVAVGTSKWCNGSLRNR